MQQDTTQCNTCGSQVLTKSLLVHNRACLKRMNKAQMSGSMVKSKMENMIPCTECGQMVEFSVYSFHIEECEGRQLVKCHQCKLLYPTFLIQQHLAVCDQFIEEEPIVKPAIVVQDIEDQEQDDLHMNELIMQMASMAKISQQPLSVGAIQKMRKVVTNQSAECSICCCQITRSNTILKLNCPHQFHFKCLSAWLQKNPLCPMCRRHALT